MAERPRRKRVDYSALHRLSTADFEVVSQSKQKYKRGAQVYEVERIISKRKTSKKNDEYLLKWKNVPIWNCSWEPSSHLSESLIRSYGLPVITPERLQHATATFLEGITSILRSKSVKALHHTDLRIDHDIMRHVFRGLGIKAADNKSMLYEKSDFHILCLPEYWHYCLDEHGQGITVDFPIKLRLVLSYTKSYYVVSSGKLQKTPISPVENVLVTLNRRACDQYNF